jgi:hypothetical protein
MQKQTGNAEHSKQQGDTRNNRNASKDNAGQRNLARILNLGLLAADKLAAHPR